MMSYLLLRNNECYGPYSLDELRSLPVQQTDLIWQEGSSTAWKHPFEIKEVAEHCQEPAKKAYKLLLSPCTESRKHVYVYRPGQPHDLFKQNASITSTSAPETGLLNRKYAVTGKKAHTFTSPLPETGKASKRRYVLYANISVFAVSLTLLLAGTTLINNVLTGFEEHAISASRATAHSAPIAPLPGGPDPKDALEDHFQNALTTEYVPASDTANEFEEAGSGRTAKKGAAKNSRKKVSISTNNFNVGLFGGIDNLELTINNNSAYKLDLIAVQVDYVRANGEIVKSEIITANSIMPHKSKTIKVPASKKGIKVDYRVKELRSRSFTTTLHSA